MPIIQQTEINDILARLPDMEPFADQARALPEPRLLLAAAGFEERARGVVQSRLSDPFEDTILVVYPTNADDNKTALEAFREMRGNEPLREVAYDRKSLRQELLLALEKHRSRKELTVVVDVSGMSSFVLYPLLYTVFEAIPQKPDLAFCTLRPRTITHRKRSGMSS